MGVYQTSSSRPYQQRSLMAMTDWWISKMSFIKLEPDSKVNGGNMGPIWGRQDPGGPHVGPTNFAIWVEQISWHILIMVTSHKRHSFDITGHSVSATICSVQHQSKYWNYAFVEIYVGNSPVTDGFLSQRAIGRKKTFHIMTVAAAPYLAFLKWILSITIPLICIWWYVLLRDMIGLLFSPLALSVSYNLTCTK